MKRKDVVSFFGLCCYIILLYGGLHSYFTTNNYCNENRSACIQQNSMIDTILMINYSETIHFQNSIIQQL